MGFRFKDPKLLKAALTHKSHVLERPGQSSNERLEFLGDSVFGSIVAHSLYETYPQEMEGALSKLKAGLVSRPALAKWARELGLGDYLILGSGEDRSGGRARPSLLSNAMEAVIGAVFLDQGFGAAEGFVRSWISSQPQAQLSDFKSQLQEHLQQRHRMTPSYEVIESFGPEHSKTFAVRVTLDKKVLGRGLGSTKKEAEQHAAQAALEKFSKSQEKKHGL